MLYGKSIVLFWVAILALGCNQGTDTQERSERGAQGKGDLVGSCLTSTCAGQAEDGDCWCDEDCESYGDCCDDRQVICEVLPCGGDTGSTCPAGFYCERPTESACGAEGHCRLSDGVVQSCLASDAIAAGPVCGCDDRSYENACEAIAAGVQSKFGVSECSGGSVGTGGLGTDCVMEPGSCDSGLICVTEAGTCSVGETSSGTCASTPEACRGDRVCGCDGNDYIDECAAFAAGVDVAASGFCEPTCNGPIPEACRENGPVCGCDGITYESQCAAFLDGEVNVISQGACS